MPIFRALRRGPRNPLLGVAGVVLSYLFAIFAGAALIMDGPGMFFAHLALGAVAFVLGRIVDFPDDD